MMDGDATADLIWDLINAGADVNLKDDTGDTALMRAASTDNLDALKTLIDAGAEVKRQKQTRNHGADAGSVRGSCECSARVGDGRR